MAAAASAADDPMIILQRARDIIAAQIKKSANYTCIQTVDRSYFRSANDLLPGCAYQSQTPSRKEIMHDRLRLDVAVSKGQEIYSWHGENSFSASAITRMVRTGPISSGGFVGYLENIFLDSDVQFRYIGNSTLNGMSGYSFEYSVPLSASRYHIQGKHASPIVPFHGSFLVDGTSFELLKLEVIAD
ncbi:MAG: hypothetical protein JO211_10520, partial [Acidobacteriaceae bacterium]|nr:hypothetical protein [Acidobacteriaceae bacterium]